MEDPAVIGSGSTLRSLPHNLEAERSVLGAILVENEALHRAQELLREDDFYRDAHRRIYRAMAQLSERSTTIDLITLKNELERDGSLGPCGGAGYIASLVDGVARSANIDDYARIVREKAMLRNLIHSSNRIITDAMAGDGEAVHILDAAERSIFQIAQDQLRPGFAPIREGAQEILRIIEERSGAPQLVTGLPTGFSQLNELTSGFQPSDLIIVAARPAMGKTTFCLNVAHFVGVRLRKAVGIFSLEMTQQQVILRLLCAEAQVDSHLLRTGRLGKPEWSKVAIALEELAAAPIFIDDSPGLTVLEMKAKARRLKAERGLDLLIVDYLQLMQAGGSRENRTQEISEISRSLKGLAKELNIPLIAISQLSRAPEIRGGTHQPQLSDLRECVTGDTLVVLADGRRVPIEGLVGQTPQVLSASKDGRIVPAPSDKVWRVGKRSVYRVCLASGRSITATGDHRLLTLDGWQRVTTLHAGARLACARFLPEPEQTETWPNRRVALLGHLIGDGSYLVHQPMRYATSSETNSALVSEAAREEFGAEVKRYRGRRTWHQLLISGNGNRWRPAGVNRWLRDLGIYGQRSHEKRIPERAFRLSNGQIALLLRHLWATDGTIHTRESGRGAPAVRYSTNSAGLAQDVAALLLRLGIVARVQRTEQGTYRPMYGVSVSGSDEQRRFLERVGAFGPRKPQAERLATALTGLSSNTNVDTVPWEVFSRVKARMRERGISQRRMAALRGTSYGGTSHFLFAPSRAVLAQYAVLLDDPELAARAADDLFWDRIVAIEPAGDADVFDLTVPEHGSWLADGIVSHNSGAIEQDADVVLFILREEVYRPTEENRGIAQLSIKKQRNGPTGDIRLAFISRFTKFADLEWRTE